MAFSPKTVCFYPPITDIFQSLVLGLTTPVPEEFTQVWVFAQGHGEVQIHLQTGHFSLHLLQYQPCFTPWGFLLPLKQGVLCRCRLLPASGLQARG